MPGVLVTSRYVEPLATCALPAPEHGMHSILVPLATAITEVPVLRQVEPRRDFPGVLAHGQVVNHRDDPQPLQFGSPCSSAALAVRQPLEFGRTLVIAPDVLSSVAAVAPVEPVRRSPPHASAPFALHEAAPDVIGDEVDEHEVGIVPA
ncbi:MAG: hypothetical protein ACRDFW_05710 [bacterium]